MVAHDLLQRTVDGGAVDPRYCAFPILALSAARPGFLALTGRNLGRRWATPSLARFDGHGAVARFERVGEIPFTSEH